MKLVDRRKQQRDDAVQETLVMCEVLRKVVEGGYSDLHARIYDVLRAVQKADRAATQVADLEDVEKYGQTEAAGDMSMREFQIEMLWDCPMGHKRQRGRHTKCEVCGRPKTEDDEYYMPDEGAEAPKVTDAEMLADAKAGPNWSCKYCGCHERRNDDECANCGVPQKDGDSEVWERDQKERFEAINPPPVPASIPEEQPTRLQWARHTKYLAIVVAILGLFGMVVWTCTSHSERVKVQRTHWERVVRLEKNVVVREDGWSPSMGSFNVTNEGMKFHHMDHRVVSHHTEYSTERYSCGQDCRTIPRVCRDMPRTCSTTPRSCRKSNCTSNKNGYATCSETCTGGDTVCTGGSQSCSGGGQDCTTKWCTRQVPHTVDDYQDFPIFQPYYSWDVWKWVPSRSVPSASDDVDPKWPAFELAEHERESGRSELYKVTFVNADNKTRDWTPRDESDFRRFSHTNWTLEVDRLGTIHTVTPR